MKFSHLILILIVTSGASAYSGSLFVNVSGILKPISKSIYPQNSTLTIWKPHLPLLPEFKFGDGIISNEDHEKHEVFGIADDYLVFGNHKNVKPFQVQLDDHFKIVNIQPYLCGLPHGSTRPFFSASDHSCRFLTCVPVDIYFLPSTEHVESESENKEKKQIEPAPAEVPEHMQSLIDSQREALIDGHSDHTDSSTIDLVPRSLIPESDHVRARKAAKKKISVKKKSLSESKLESVVFLPFRVLRAEEFLLESNSEAQGSK